MTRVVILGQAPARTGNGLPFTGSSGSRLCRLLDLSNYEALDRRFDLMNLLPAPVARRASGRGDSFDRVKAEQQAKTLVRQWAADEELHVVIACGHEVFRSLTDKPGTFFKGKVIGTSKARRVDIWCFPHPSGASSFWNDQRNTLQAKVFLHGLLKRYGIDMAR